MFHCLGSRYPIGKQNKNVGPKRDKYYNITRLGLFYFIGELILKLKLILQNHINLLINSIHNGVDTVDTSLFTSQLIENIEINDSNQNRAINVRLLCGADLLESFAVPGLWNPEDVCILIGINKL